MKLAAVETLKVASASSDAGEALARKQAAQQFEGLLVRELVSAMRATAPMMQEGQGKSYMEMFDSALADHIAASGGVGIASVVERSFGQSPQDGGLVQQPAMTSAWRSHPLHVAKSYQLSSARGDEPVGALHGKSLTGETGRLQQVAGQMLAQDAGAWGRDGVLGPRELQSDFVTGSTDGVTPSRFNVRDASGFEGSYKCNLFALEAARRGGFKVPVVAREAGWGYPSSEAVTNDAAEGKASWARVVTGAAPATLDKAIVDGRSAFLVSGAGTEDRAGHMAVVERIRDIRYDEEGQVTQIVFDGWEARSRGAQYLSERTWNLRGQSGGNMVRGGFSRIEILELQRAPQGQRPEQPQNAVAPRSWLDAFDSSSSYNHPNP